VWQLYKQLTDSKPLKDADRDDGRKLVKYFMDKGLKSATIEKKIAWLNAAVNLAIKESKLKFNPFAGIIPRLDDAERRLPLDDADMKVIRANLNRLDKSDQLLLRILAATGMRLAEAFGVDSEQTERRCRFVIVGTKTEQSPRRVPLPAAVLPFVRASYSLAQTTPRRNGSIDSSTTLASQTRARSSIACGTVHRIGSGLPDAPKICDGSFWATKRKPSRRVMVRAIRCGCCASGLTRSAAKVRSLGTGWDRRSPINNIRLRGEHGERKVTTHLPGPKFR